jgi:hypothetical protein
MYQLSDKSFVLFYKRKKFLVDIFCERKHKTSRRHFVLGINIDFFCKFIHRLELSLFIPSILLPVGFFSSPPPLFSLSFSFSLCGGGCDARELLFFCGYLPKKT